MATSDTAPASGSILVILLSILLPPLGVALSRGIGTQFLINILLTTNYFHESSFTYSIFSY